MPTYCSDRCCIHNCNTPSDFSICVASLLGVDLGVPQFAATCAKRIGIRFCVARGPWNIAVFRYPCRGGLRGGGKYYDISQILRNPGPFKVFPARRRQRTKENVSDG